MKITIVTILIILLASCSEKEPTSKLNQLDTDKDIPTPKSDITTTNLNEGLAPQTCYYGCKARK